MLQFNITVTVRDQETKSTDFRSSEDDIELLEGLIQYRLEREPITLNEIDEEPRAIYLSVSTIRPVH